MKLKVLSRDDHKAEGTEYFKAKLRPSVIGDYTVAGGGKAKISILDND